MMVLTLCTAVYGVVWKCLGGHPHAACPGSKVPCHQPPTRLWFVAGLHHLRSVAQHGTPLVTTAGTSALLPCCCSAVCPVLPLLLLLQLVTIDGDAYDASATNHLNTIHTLLESDNVRSGHNAGGGASSGVAFVAAQAAQQFATGGDRSGSGTSRLQ